jgi:hypothetical protein
MITAVLIIAEAFRTNKNFQPTFLYLGTLMADIAIFQAIFGTGM